MKTALKKSAFLACAALIVLAALAALAIFRGIPGKGKEAASAAPAAPASSNLSDAAFPDTSLYQLPSVWTDDEGRSLRLGELAGKTRLLTLFFGHCESSCPMMLGRLKALEAGLPEGWTRHAGMVLVTLDPGRDDAESLAEFRKRMEFGREGWTLLRGGPEDTRELAMLLGVAYRESAANGGIEHNSVLVLLDPRGVVLHRYEGADPGPAFMDELRKALSTPAPTR